MNKKILVTGGAGFIGSHLCKHLLEQDNEVICVDNFFTGSKNNILNLMNNPKFEIIQHDIAYPLHLEIDQIYNLACPASPIHYQYNPIKTIKTNTVGMLNILGLAKRTNARILQASTSEVYGDPINHPQKETDWGNVNPIGPRSCYDEGKRVAESLMFSYNSKNNTDIKIIRIFNTYGPNMALNDGRVISNFIIQALSNQDLTVYGKGTQSRSFCYVSDLITGMVKMMNCDDFTGPVNLGNPNEKTIIEIAEKIIKLTDSKSDIQFKELPQDDPVRRLPDISLARNKLSWQPKVNLEEGLNKTIEYFKEKVKK